MALLKFRWLTIDAHSKYNLLLYNRLKVNKSIVFTIIQNAIYIKRLQFMSVKPQPKAKLHWLGKQQVIKL